MASLQNLRRKTCCRSKRGSVQGLLIFAYVTNVQRAPYCLRQNTENALQEQEALVKELTEVLQRQKTRVAALQKERAEQSAQLAAYQPAEQDKLRAEMNTLRERVGELAGIKVSKLLCCRHNSSEFY